MINGDFQYIYYFHGDFLRIRLNCHFPVVCLMYTNAQNKKGFDLLKLFILCELVWEHTGSNRGPSACKADALNQLSYAPF